MDLISITHQVPLSEDDCALSSGYAAAMDAAMHGNHYGTGHHQDPDETTPSDVSERPSVDDVESDTGSTGALETRSLKDHKGNVEVVVLVDVLTYHKQLNSAFQILFFANCLQISDGYNIACKLAAVKLNIAHGSKSFTALHNITTSTEQCLISRQFNMPESGVLLLPSGGRAAEHIWRTGVVWMNQGWIQFAYECDKRAIFRNNWINL